MSKISNLEDAIKLWKSKVYKVNKPAVKEWWKQIDKWRKTDSLNFKEDKETIKDAF